MAGGESWSGYGQTDIGTTRDENQDSFVVLDSVGIWCVADGMGGHKEGSIASHLVTQTLESFENQTFQDFEELLVVAQKAILDANVSLCEMSRNFYGQDVIGTTIVALLIKGDTCAVIWAGDSRLYRMRGTAFEMITTDHTQYEEFVAQGLIQSDEQGASHPTNHILTRALGAQSTLELEVARLSLQSDDVFLLCTDGLSNVIEQLDLGKIIYFSEDKQRAVANLINRALAMQANDNVTALIVDKV